MKLKLLSALMAAVMLVTSVPFCAQAAGTKAAAAKISTSASASRVYPVKYLPYNYNATAVSLIALKGNKNQSSPYKIGKGTNVCVVNVLKLKRVVLYEVVFLNGKKFIHGYVQAGTLNFRYQSWYTSINKQPVYSLNGKTKVANLNKGQKATKLYMVGKKCAVLFDTKCGKNTGIGIVNYKGHKF